MQARSVWVVSLVLGLAAGCASAPKTEAKSQAAGVRDADEDGIADDVDECVTEKEDHKPPKPEDGCKADPNDLDGDGIGKADKCPNQAETQNGFEDEDGCPDEIPRETAAVVTVTHEELKCCAKILFPTGKATIDPLSLPVLEHLAKTLKDHPEIELLEVAGHADSVGNADKNVDLTRKRAEAVVTALAALAIDKGRLRAMGYGSYCPVADGDTPEAREINRRVEFKIVRQSGADTGAPLGCDAARAKGIGAGAPKPAGKPSGST